MQRIASQPRPNWEPIVESQGFYFHTDEEGHPYWNESAYYRFTATQIDELETATYALDKMCLAAVQYVIDEKLFDRFQIPAEYVPWVERSWERDECTVYGRFDLAYDGVTPPKLLEFNADTPTALLEASVIQWHWMKDLFPNLDQFNSLHERLIAAWKRFAPTITGTLYFSAVEGSIEDCMTANYLRDTAMQAGIDTQYIDVQKIGWNARQNAFVDLMEKPIMQCFRLYPWEWMLREAFGAHLLQNTTRWLEAPWKMILSNKAILPILHEMNPDSPYILEAAFEPIADDYVCKPCLSREGQSIAIVRGGQTEFATAGTYPGPYIYQRFAPLPSFDSQHPVIGSWLVDGYAAGIGIREDSSLVTGNLSRFVPHVFEP